MSDLSTIEAMIEAGVRARARAHALALRRVLVAEYLAAERAHTGAQAARLAAIRDLEAEAGVGPRGAFRVAPKQ